jgi:hypothetical protein
MHIPGKYTLSSDAFPLPSSRVRTPRGLLPVSGADTLTELLSQRLASDPATLKLWRELVIKHLAFFSSPISEEIREEGRAQSRAEDILLVLEQRGIDVPDQVREQITNCRNTTILRHWLRHAVTAPTAKDVFTDE